MSNKELIQTEQIRSLLEQAVTENITPTVFLGQVTQLKIPISLEELDAYVLPTNNEGSRVALMIALVEKNLLLVNDSMKKIILKQRQ